MRERGDGIEQVLGKSFPWCSGWAAELKQLFAPMSKAKQRQNILDYDDLLLYWAQPSAIPLWRQTSAAPLRPCPGRRVPGYEPPAVLILLALKPGGRGLTVVVTTPSRSIRLRGDRAQHSRLPQPIQSASHHHHAGSQLPLTQTILAAANGVIELASERFTKNLWTERTSSTRPQLVSVRDEADQARYIVERVLESRESGTVLKQTGGTVPHLASQRPAGGRTDPAKYPVREVRRAQVSRCRAYQGYAGDPRFVENPRDRVAGFRLMHLIPGVGSTSAQRVLDHMARSADPTMALAEAPSPPRAGGDWRNFVDAVTELRSGRAGWPAELERARLWYEPHLDRIHEDAGTRRADLVQLEQIAGGYPSRQRFLTN